MAVLAAIEKPTAFLDREGDGFNPILAICCFCSSSYLVLSWGDCCHIQREQVDIGDILVDTECKNCQLCPMSWMGTCHCGGQNTVGSVCWTQVSDRWFLLPLPCLPLFHNFYLLLFLAGVTSHFPQTQLGLLTVAWCPPGEAMLFSCQQLLLCFFLPFCRIIATFNKCLKDEDWY